MLIKRVDLMVFLSYKIVNAVYIYFQKYISEIILKEEESGLVQVVPCFTILFRMSKKYKILSHFY
jgi:hypothetical protein